MSVPRFITFAVSVTPDLLLRRISVSLSNNYPQKEEFFAVAVQNIIVNSSDLQLGLQN